MLPARMNVQLKEVQMTNKQAGDLPPWNMFVLAIIRRFWLWFLYAGRGSVATQFDPGLNASFS